MGLCETVAGIADAVERDLSPAEPRQKLQLAILRLGPLYRDTNKLNAWDEALRAVFQERDDNSILDQAIGDVSDLATFNMYGSFDSQGTQCEYDVVRKRLAKSGVRLSADADLADW